MDSADNIKDKSRQIAICYGNVFNYFGKLSDPDLVLLISLKVDQSFLHFFYNLFHSG